jgi:hypothetical protein
LLFARAIQHKKLPFVAIRFGSIPIDNSARWFGAVNWCSIDPIPQDASSLRWKNPDNALLGRMSNGISRAWALSRPHKIPNLGAMRNLRQLLRANHHVHPRCLFRVAETPESIRPKLLQAAAMVHR